MLYNVFVMSQALAELEGTGERVSDEVLAAISPYLTQHVNRLGRYALNTKRKPPMLNYDIFTRPAPVKKQREGSLAVV
jgi:Tn3 transposase DDE domain